MKHTTNEMEQFERVEDLDRSEGENFINKKTTKRKERK